MSTLRQSVNQSLFLHREKEYNMPLRRENGSLPRLKGVHNETGKTIGAAPLAGFVRSAGSFESVSSPCGLWTGRLRQWFNQYKYNPNDIDKHQSPECEHAGSNRGLAHQHSGQFGQYG